MEAKRFKEKPALKKLVALNAKSVNKPRTTVQEREETPEQQSEMVWGMRGCQHFRFQEAQLKSCWRAILG